MTENACQTSLNDYMTKVPTEEILKLKEENFILQGKIRGYATLGNLLREQKEECSKLKKMNESLKKLATPSSPGAGMSFSQDSGSEGNRSMNGDTGTSYKNPGEIKQQTVESENIDVSLKSNYSSNGIPDPCITEQSKTNNYKQVTRTLSWTDQISGATYPPCDMYQPSKMDKYPTQESISSDIKLELSDSQKRPISIVSNGIENPVHKDHRAMLRSSSTIVHVGSDSNSKSLNLMEFPSEHLDDSTKTASSSHSKVVSASSSQSSSFQVIKPGLSRQCSKSETALSLHVNEIMNGDLGSDGPSQKMRKMLEDILPDLTKIEEENENFKVENKRLLEENHRLLRKVQQLELQVNNVSPTESLSSQTQVVDWDYVSKSELQKSKIVEKESTQTTENSTRLQKLEQQNRELLQANSRWEKMFKEMRSDQENKTKHSQYQIETLKEQLTKMNLEDETRRCEYDRILLTTKNRLEDEESAKDALQAQLAEYQVSYDQLQKDKRELEESLNAINREQLAREAELSVLRQGIGGDSIQAIHVSSDSDLRTEIAVLREQLTVFQEDFDRERSDRAKAQSEKDDINKQLGKLRTENHKLVDQNKRYQTQLQTAEVNVKEAIEESTRLNSANVELRNKVRQLESQLLSQQVPPTFTPNITSTRPQHSLMVQPETDPYARPSPPYIFHQNQVGPGNLQSNRERYPQEQQPGAWNCDDCTYSNHPTRSVCEMCGKIKLPGITAVQNPSSSPTLWRRGENGEQNDLSSDCVR
ncbi:TNFAIP3-interacting protein 1-like isoform X1 [Mytilus edulis]|uniref:TNFAIP3-interacting protein 1-like isoform X1 n=1 Tax=Mytilus edulis TaxID=6550 RepID=UPI0039F10EC9